MFTKPFSETKNKGKLFLVAKSSGPLLARMPLKKLLHMPYKRHFDMVINKRDARYI